MKVGADIESICRKCGDVWHVVLALKGAAVAKVECKQCGAQHRYRPPAGDPAKPVKKKAPAKKKATGTAASRAKAKAKAAEAEGPRIEPDMNRSVQAYAMTKHFEPADRIKHKTFGEGTVEGPCGAGKIEVWFEDGRRMLAHDRKDG